jgi:hypothetical protein
VVVMSRSNTRTGTGRRKPAGEGAMSTLLLNEGASQPGGRKKTRLERHAPVGEPDVMQDILTDIDTILEKQAAHDAPNTGIARRRIEMLREAQWLHSQLADSYDS